mgnify:CR=1 FL=1
MRTNRRKHPQDALRWLMAVFVSAVIASAITSAIFLTARPDSPEIEPHNQQAQAAREVAQLLLPELEAFAQQQLQDNQQVATCGSRLSRRAPSRGWRSAYGCARRQNAHHGRTRALAT